MLGSDDRGVTGLIRVGLVVIFVMLLLWIFSIVGPATIEPVHDVASNQSAVGADEQTKIDNVQTVALNHAPKLIGVGIMALAIAYAAWRERFVGARRPPR